MVRPQSRCCSCSLNSSSSLLKFSALHKDARQFLMSIWSSLRLSLSTSEAFSTVVLAVSSLGLASGYPATFWIVSFSFAAPTCCSKIRVKSLVIVSHSLVSTALGNITAGLCFLILLSIRGFGSVGSSTNLNCLLLDPGYKDLPFYTNHQVWSHYRVDKSGWATL